jgi:ribosomal protein S18 acetylase RimI-like enzyme
MLGRVRGIAARGHVSERLCRRLARQPSAARCHVQFVDLTDGAFRAIATRVPVAWETAHDLASIEGRVRALPLEYWSDVSDRLARDHWCVVGLCDGVVAHAAWTGIGTFKAHWFDRWFRLQPGEAYFYGAYTLPSFRGLRIHPASVLERLRQARERGIRRVYWFVDPANYAARQLPARIGAARIGTAGYFEVAGVRLHYLTDVGHLTQSNPRFLIERR